MPDAALVPEPGGILDIGLALQCESRDPACVAVRMLAAIQSADDFHQHLEAFPHLVQLVRCGPAGFHTIRVSDSGRQSVVTQPGRPYRQFPDGWREQGCREIHGQASFRLVEYEVEGHLPVGLTLSLLLERMKTFPTDSEWSLDEATYSEAAARVCGSMESAARTDIRMQVVNLGQMVRRYDRMAIAAAVNGHDSKRLAAECLRSRLGELFRLREHRQRAAEAERRNLAAPGGPAVGEAGKTATRPSPKN